MAVGLPSLDPLSTTVIVASSTSPSCAATASRHSSVSRRLFQLTTMISVVMVWTAAEAAAAFAAGLESGSSSLPHSKPLQARKDRPRAMNDRGSHREHFLGRVEMRCMTEFAQRLERAAPLMLAHERLRALRHPVVRLAIADDRHDLCGK